MLALLRHRLILAVRDLQVSTEFWMSMLGFTRDFGDGSDGWSWLSRGGFAVGLGECANEPAASTLGDHSYVAFVTVEDGAVLEETNRAGEVHWMGPTIHEGGANQVKETCRLLESEVK